VPVTCQMVDTPGCAAAVGIVLAGA
jgi:hypothetical protein